jgi:V/A-type H+-transporting ATPase subunit A
LFQLVGRDGLSEEDKWILLKAELIRIVYLQQNAFSDADASCSTRKQFEILDALKRLDDVVRRRIIDGVVFEEIAEIPFLGDLLRSANFRKPISELKRLRWLNDQMNRVSGLVVLPK